MAKKSISFLFIVLIAAGQSFADSPVTSFRSVSKHGVTGKAYIPAGYPDNHEPYASELDKLWNLTDKTMSEDKFTQPWKEVDVAALEKIIGEIPKLYYFVYPVRKLQQIDARSSRFVVDHYEVEKRHIQRAALFKWGCGGQIIPVLIIGQWPKVARVPVGMFAISVSRDMGDGVTKALDESLIPPKVLSKMEGLYEGITLNWENPKEVASIIIYKEPNTGSRDYGVFSYGMNYKLDDFSYFPIGGLFDYRC